MKLSLIMPVYDDLAAALRALNSLRATQQTGVEYHVQDDASPAHDFRALIPPLLAQVERNAGNLGFAGNANAGAQRASGDVLFFCNQDVYAAPAISAGWDAAILRAFDDPAVGVVGARLLFPDGRVQSAGGGFDARGQPFHYGLGWRGTQHPHISTPRAVGWVTGAALAIRRSLFEQIGGFDSAYVGGYWEDVDLCLKARQTGCVVWYAPGATLFHTVGSSGGNPRTFTRNALLFRNRWGAQITPDVPAVMARFW